MKPRLHYSAVLLGLGLALAGCGETAKKDRLRPDDKAPAIASLGKQKAPSREKLIITESEPVAADPEKALDNYRKILELSPDPTMRQEALRRMADLQVQVDDAQGGDADSEKRLSDSIRIYGELLREHPEDANNDRVLYQLARAQQNSGQPQAAVEALSKLLADYPASRYASDAHFRRAELLYRLARYDEAEAEYRIVIALPDVGPFFEPAQYKLGWALFKQSKFEDALPVFFAILDRELPPGELKDVDASLKAVSQGKADLAKDSLRVTSLTFAVMGGGKAVNEYFAAHPEPRFYPLVYNALGELFLDKRRFSDAADAYAAFIERHASHPSAPQFQARVIEVYRESGFNDFVVREKERYVNTYAPGAAYWAASPPSEEVMSALHTHLDDLAKHYHAAAQASQPPQPAAFLIAAGWYKRALDIFPKDAKAPETHYLFAETLEDGGQPLEAARQYLRTAYEYPAHERSQDAAWAAVIAFHTQADSADEAGKPAALQQAVAASLKLADSFPSHPQVLAALTRTAQDLYTLKQQDQAIEIATRVLANNPPPSAEQRRIVQGVLGDSQFAKADYPRAEIAYADLLKLTPSGSPERSQVVEQLAASVYKQAEAARTAGDLKAAAAGFLRVGQVTPEASIRATADYDAAAALIGLASWSEAATVLEGFRSRYPGNPRLTEVDKKLALIYVKDGKPYQAADAYRRIAGRESEEPGVRRDAAWQAARLFDDANKPADAIKAYEFFVGAYPSPLEQAMEARRRLADLYKAKPDLYRYLFWLREMLTAEDYAARERTERTRTLAAQAALDIGRLTAADASKIALSLPVEKSLPLRKNAVEAAIQSLEKAAGYGFADITTAATYELGAVYQSFGKALMTSERPRNLKGEELEQYNLLLEEQALPFEDKAIAAYEANLKRVGQGLWDASIASSVTALGVLSPAKYGKREVAEESYESLK